MTAHYFFYIYTRIAGSFIFNYYLKKSDILLNKFVSLFTLITFIPKFLAPLILSILSSKNDNSLEFIKYIGIKIFTRFNFMNFCRN